MFLIRATCTSLQLLGLCHCGVGVGDLTAILDKDKADQITLPPPCCSWLIYVNAELYLRRRHTRVFIHAHIHVHHTDHHDPTLCLMTDIYDEYAEKISLTII